MSEQKLVPTCPNCDVIITLVSACSEGCCTYRYCESCDFEEDSPPKYRNIRAKWRPIRPGETYDE